MAKFRIIGGAPIEGVWQAAGNKNAALPMLAASLLTPETVTLEHVPLIQDVRVMLDLLSDLGVEIKQQGHKVELCAAHLKHATPRHLQAQQVRGSILLAGPLLTRFKTVRVTTPGGDRIGRRRLDTHFHGFECLGATCTPKNGYYEVTRSQLKGNYFMLDEASVTATENLIMVASRCQGKTVLYNCACEPHVQDLCRLLQKMGAHIDGIGTNQLTIVGSESLQGATHRVGPDYIEAGSYLAAAAATKGSLRIQNMDDTQASEVIRRGFGKMGLNWRIEKVGHWDFSAGPTPLAIREDYGQAIPKLEDGPWPNFPSDLMSVAIVLATQAQGSMLFFEKMFESRMYFVDRLIEMGAKIIQCDPHRIMLIGGTQLQGRHLTSPDIRAGMALVIAALCAEGESIIDNAQMIDRGYEDLDIRLQQLGANIERIES